MSKQKPTKSDSSISEEKSKQTSSSAKKINTTTTPRKLANVRMVQNFLLVWLDGNIDEEKNEDYRNKITKLRQVVNTVNTFTDVDECIDFISDVNEEKVFVISSGAFGQTTVPVLHEMSHVSSIYIFCENKGRHEQWAKQWSKVKGVFTDIKPIYEALKQAVQDCDQNTVAMNFVTPSIINSSKNLDQLDQSFMYTQILKEILFTINFEEINFYEFITYCREQFVGNTAELQNINKLEKEYRRHSSIWWYTYHSFLYSMLNRALRTIKVDLIIKMGFFVRALHEHIAQLHSEQHAGHSTSFTVFRGQGLSKTDFDQLLKTKGGLVSFNNFLSTSSDRAVSFAFAESNGDNPDLTGVLFVITIDPSVSSTAFANIRDVSFYQTEEEILFSMHCVFRIGQMKQMDGNKRLWQVDLTLTSDNDPQLSALTESMREKTFSGCKGWERLGNLLITLGQFNKAQQVCEVLLEQVSNEREEAGIYHLLVMVKDGQGEHPDAITFSEKSIQIRQKILPPTHPELAASYSNIGLVYSKMGDYSKALSYYGKVLEIDQKTIPANHPDLATSYNNIGSVYDNLGDYSKALSYYEKALENSQKTLPPNHPDLANSYNNIGLVYCKMGDYLRALSYYEKALEIDQKTLPPNHPSLAISYNNIGMVYHKMGDYSKALSYLEKDLEISQKTLPPNHPSLAACYNNIGLVYDKIGDYSKALSYYEKDLEISQKTLPPNHPDLAACYNNIGLVYSNMGDYSKALPFFERAVDIGQHSVPANHPHLETYKKSLEFVKKKL